MPLRDPERVTPCRARGKKRTADVSVNIGAARPSRGKKKNRQTRGMFRITVKEAVYLHFVRTAGRLVWVLGGRFAMPGLILTLFDARTGRCGGTCWKWIDLEVYRRSVF